jgi:hypothetical protein
MTGDRFVPYSTEEVLLQSLVFGLNSCLLPHSVSHGLFDPLPSALLVGVWRFSEKGTPGQIFPSVVRVKVRVWVRVWFRIQVWVRV